MTSEVWVPYAGTVLLLRVAPGPSHLLMLSNSLSSGPVRASATAAGDLTANLLQMLAAGLGVAALLVVSGAALEVVKWAGALWLIWLGISALRRAGHVRDPGRRPRKTLRALWLEGFLTSAANPKAVIFFAALFPQFISPDLPFWPQFALLSVSYLVLDALFLAGYGIGAGILARALNDGGGRWLNRAGGLLLIGAGLLLGARSVEASRS